MANRVVQLVAADNSVLAVTTTNTQGEYSFFGIENGTYQVREVLPVGATCAAVTSASIAITQRSTFDNVALAIPTVNTPKTPTKPNGPTHPSGPAKPNGPTHPSGPTNPNVPNHPSGPTKPNTPHSPSGPQREQPQHHGLTAAAVGMSRPTQASVPAAAPKTTPPPGIGAPANASKPVVAQQTPKVSANVLGVSGSAVKPLSPPPALPPLVAALVKAGNKLR